MKIISECGSDRDARASIKVRRLQRRHCFGRIMSSSSGAIVSTPIASGAWWCLVIAPDTAAATTPLRHSASD